MNSHRAGRNLPYFVRDPLVMPPLVTLFLVLTVLIGIVLDLFFLPTLPAALLGLLLGAVAVVVLLVIVFPPYGKSD